MHVLSSIALILTFEFGLMHVLSSIALILTFGFGLIFSFTFLLVTVVKFF